ncbi:hypothetical protein [Rhizobium sp. RU36D]|uniref:hypothetical protein n=1 Tax=Rhizobium sp. RU36D TaxID=1907415 RepID=UPI0009D7E6F9|nr:hypothetical protein [Rhizobium sp. RU36D]SMD18619.1 hypothetical protein SAMN05880593_13551 [Rhizobium sp. RU36D]
MSPRCTDCGEYFQSEYEAQAICAECQAPEVALSTDATVEAMRLAGDIIDRLKSDMLASPVDDVTIIDRSQLEAIEAAIVATPSSNVRLVDAVSRAADDAIVSAIYATYKNGVFVKDELLAPAEVRFRVNAAIRAALATAAEGK